MNKKKAFNICLSAVITIGFVLLGVFVYKSSYFRLIESCTDFIASVKFFFCEIFGIAHNTYHSVTGYSEVMRWDILLPADFESFKVQADEYFKLLLDADNFMAWVNSAGEGLENTAKVLVIAVPCVLVLLVLLKRLYGSSNTKHNKDTVPLRVFKCIGRYTYQPVKEAVTEYIRFLKEYRWIWIVWLVMWAFHLNLMSIMMSFFAYYFYFAVSYDVLGIYVQAVKLVIDLQPVVKTVPVWVALPIAWYVFERFRRRIADNRLRHY